MDDATLMDRIENQLCARLLANAHALGVAAARLAAELADDDGEEEQDAERWDGLS